MKWNKTHLYLQLTGYPASLGFPPPTIRPSHHAWRRVMAAISVSGIPLGWGGSIFLGDSQSRSYPNTCAKFGCGPTVVSKKEGDRQTDKGTLQLYIVDTVMHICCTNITDWSEFDSLHDVTQYTYIDNQTSNDVRFWMLRRKEERWEQTKFSRNEYIEMGKREDQVGPHQKWRHQEGGTHKTCWQFPGKQKTKVVWPLLEARTQPHPCEIAKSLKFLGEGAEVDRKRDGDKGRHEEVPTDWRHGIKSKTLVDPVKKGETFLHTMLHLIASPIFYCWATMLHIHYLCTRYASLTANVSRPACSVRSSLVPPYTRDSSAQSWRDRPWPRAHGRRSTETRCLPWGSRS